METLLQISYLNDFIFCPYSIYLHQVFDNSNEVVYSAAPQQRGKTAHYDIDSFSETQNAEEGTLLKGIYVVSNKLGLYGKIDTYDIKQKKLIESKYLISNIYRGYYYQLWSQYFAMIEMGFEVEYLSFYSIKESKEIGVPIPTQSNLDELRQHIRKIAHFDFSQAIKVNPNKCKHCIYASLCHKTNYEHVYT